MKYLKTILAYTYAITIGVLGYSLYFLSKILRSLGYLCMLKLNSAKSEVSDFWSVSQSVLDL